MTELKSSLSNIQKRRIEAATSIRSERAKRIDFLHTVQCQTSLPYRDPGDHVREWDRKQGTAALRIEAGSALDPRSKEYVKLGLPYGEKPRLVLIHLASEAIRTGSPVIDVEDSMTAFARSLGLETNGHHLRGLKDQITRLASATIRMGIIEQGRVVQVNTQVASAFDLWFPDEVSQRVLWPSTVRLSHEFFESLSRHAIPLDNRAVGAIANSPLALDIYVWLSQRLHRVTPGNPQFIPWTALYEQFGQGYNRIRDFRKKFLATLQQVRAVYPDSRIDSDLKGINLYHSPPPVPSTKTYLDPSGKT
ncbi:replication protein RepA [Fimbriiglobus ruber]|uniref:IncW-like replication protein n=1 Tax=Fimbriiglobus ruber TaxID=1908690 RepID=A0A225E3X2_9BACT|nr:replication protein RepA [Fimbriiglobus ruber]OWK46454.1 IncW-like replication protein [Fimbriiglobus ruber]